MNMVKVYDKNGNHVDQFSKKSIPTNYYVHIKCLNQSGFYVRSQFSKSGKTLQRSLA